MKKYIYSLKFDDRSNMLLNELRRDLDSESLYNHIPFMIKLVESVFLPEKRKLEVMLKEICSNPICFSKISQEGDFCFLEAENSIFFSRLESDLNSLILNEESTISPNYRRFLKEDFFSYSGLKILLAQGKIPILKYKISLSTFFFSVDELSYSQSFFTMSNIFFRRLKRVF